MKRRQGTQPGPAGFVGARVVNGWKAAEHGRPAADPFALALKVAVPVLLYLGFKRSGWL